MLRILFAISFIALLACNSGETTQGIADSAGDTPPVSAARTGADDIEIKKVEVEAIEVETLAAEISSCLGLVKTGAFADALPVCLEAASIDPENTQVQAALAKAQAQAAVDASIDEAAGSASGAAANALGGALD
jgi:hypothetical protein